MDTTTLIIVAGLGWLVWRRRRHLEDTPVKDLEDLSYKTETVHGVVPVNPLGETHSTATTRFVARRATAAKQMGVATRTASSSEGQSTPTHTAAGGVKDAMESTVVPFGMLSDLDFEIFTS